MYHAPRRFAIRWMRGRFRSDSSITRTIRAIAGIRRQTGRFDHDRRFTIDGSGDYRGARSLRDLERLARKQRLIHMSVAFDDDAVSRADLMRQHDQVGRRSWTSREMPDPRSRSATRRCAICGARFASARKSADARRVANRSSAMPPASIRTMTAPYKILAQQQRGDQRHARQQIGAKLSSRNLAARSTASGRPPRTRTAYSGSK